MKLYLKGDYTKDIPFNFPELAQKMWFEEYEGKKPDLSYAGYFEIREVDELAIQLKLNKWVHDCRWLEAPLKSSVTNKFTSHKYENIELDFEDAPMSDYREKGNCLRVATTHLEPLTVDKRAACIMVIEVATAIDGQISEDDKETWLTVEEFQALHEDVLTLTYEEANEMSLEEIPTMNNIPDPIWAEDDRRREEYIQLHGERVYEDEDDEEFDNETDDNNDDTEDCFGF